MPEHPPPQKKPEDEKPSSSAMPDAFARAEKEKREKSAEEAKRREKNDQKNRRNERPYKGKGNPWGIYGDRRKIIDKEFKELYSNSQEIPPDVLDTYLALRDKQLESFKSGKKREQEAVANELESFIARQHVDAKILPTEVGKHVTQEVPAGVAGEAEPDGRKEPTITIEPEPREVPEPARAGLSAGLEVDQQENANTPQEETRAGWYKKLKELVKNAPEKVSGAAKEASERFTKSKNYLNERAKNIDAAAEMSGLEKWTRFIGEKYNKLSPIHKLGIGVTLGVGTAVGSAISLPVALGGLTLLVAQRAAGAAGMFVSLEKKLQEKKVGESHQFIAIKERAALDALLYTAVIGTAITKGLELARDYDVYERTRDWWLGDKPEHHTAPPSGVAHPAPATPHEVKNVLPTGGEAPATEAPAPIKEGILASDIKTQIRGIESPPVVDPDTAEMPPATGTMIGFEMSAAAAEAPTVTAQPEVAAPLTPDVGVIPPPEKVIPEPTFESPPPKGPVIAAPSGEGSVLPEAGGAPSEPLIEVKNEPEAKFAKVSVDDSGNVSINGVLENSGASAELSAETSPSAAPEPPPATEPSKPALMERPIPSAQPVSSPAEPPPVRIDTTVLDYPARSGEPLIEHVKEVNAELYRDLAPPGESSVVGDGEGNVVHDRFGKPVHSGFESPPSPPQTLMVEHAKEFVNPNNVPINPLQGHVFQDPNGVVVAYGNDFTSRFNAAQSFAKAHSGTSVWVQAEKPIFYQGEWRPWVMEIRHGGWWRGVQILNPNGPSDLSQIGAVKPETFIKQLDK